MNLPPYAKAIVAALAAGLAPVATDAATNPHGVTASTGVASVITALLGLVATYLVPNGQKAKAPGLVVNVKTDAAAFAAAFVDGLPELVKYAMQAALKPAPADAPTPSAPVLEHASDAATPVAPVAAPETTVEPAILGKA